MLKNKLIRFFLVSGMNTAFGYGFFAVLLYLNVHYSFAIFFSTVAGILFNFKTISIMVFRNDNNMLFFKFLGVYGISFLGNLGGVALLKSFEINAFIGGAILLLPMGLLTFFLNKYFVFSY